VILQGKIACGTGVICETWALQAAVIPVPPWREESTRQTFGNALSTDWIPAFAGMTGVSKGIPSQMTPPPRLPDVSRLYIKPTQGEKKG
jgi:hypothetical protein